MKKGASEGKKLKEYRVKRNFDKTPEPVSEVKPKPKGGKLSFVIQRHEARRLHYDLRLEAAGVYKSWAVPKGLPEKPGQKFLAIEVEDHPLSYGKFEGRIPEGNYGAGMVKIWDKGHYESLEKPIEEAYRKGKIHLHLKGKRVDGKWHLVKTNFPEKPQWLLIKTQESVKKFPQHELKKINGPNKEEILPKKTVLIQNWVEPMLALLTTHLPKSKEWQYEVKFDGIRALAYFNDKKPKLYSRNKIELTSYYPEVVEALKKIKCRSAILDGELTALDAKGRPSFQALQNARDKTRGVPVLYYLFDMISLNGKRLTRHSFTKRKEKLAALLPKSDLILRESATFSYPPDVLLKEIEEKGLEGVIAKKKSSLYEAGQRTGSWLKYKLVKEQEFVIGGYTKPQGSRLYFGALIVGYYESKKLICVGKVGTGFDQTNSEDLFERFQKLRVENCPFANLPLPVYVSPNWSPQRLKNYTWLKPVLVCQIKFSEWTQASFLRQPVFLGLRIDKEAREVKREI
ncbi:MAG: non-homologous end-joining DNA ligase [Verrucomicrobiae bacterium]|nr:non-homologous end-joining DNA ligase [Verrucomicrobiae bacterium]